MRFPETDRVVYRQNPLAEVICQVRFPRLLAIETEPPAAFQKSLGTRFPELRESRSVNLPDELARTLGFDPGLVVQRAYDFLSKDQAWRISLTSGYVALTATQYVRWEEFRKQLAIALDALADSYQVIEYARTGLRYKDVIRRSALDLVDVDWSALLNPTLLGELISKDLKVETADVMHAARELVLSVDHVDGHVRLFHGLAQATLSDGRPETCYVIDADFFREKNMERKDAEATLDRFHTEAGHLFRWCISDKLHHAMEPTPP